MNAPACTSRPFHSNVCVCVCVCVSNRRTPALTFPLANCTDRQPFSSRLPLVRLRLVLSSSSLSLSFLHSPFSFRPTMFCSVSVSSFVDPAWRSCLCSPSNTLEHPRTPIPVVGFAYRHCCSHQPPSILCCTLGCTLVRLIVSRRHAYRPGTARFHRPARPIVSIKGHLAHPRINYYA